jgi:hypothetical protein
MAAATQSKLVVTASLLSGASRSLLYGPDCQHPGIKSSLVVANIITQYVLDA